MIEIGEDGRTWLLSGPTSSYALRLTDLDELLHLHWGPRITLADAESLAALPGPPYRPFESRLDGREEYPVEGGPRFVRPALSVRTQERRGTEWRFDAYEADGDELRLRFADDGLGITLHYRMRGDVVERWVTLANEGPSLELLRADSATWTLPERDGWRLSQLHGRWAAESRLARSPSPTVRRSSAAAAGTPGTSTCRGSRWTARRVRRAARSTRARSAGRARGASAWPNSPTRACRSPAARGMTTPGCCVWSRGVVHHPVFAGLWSDGGFGAASRTWHAYQRAFVIPDADQDRPVLFNSWEATHFDISEERQRELARRAAEMGVELFVVDDGWFGARTSDRAGLGDWTPNPDRFPQGLKLLADDVHALGMQFGIWVEPEMVNPDSELYRAHPDWVQFQPGRTRTEFRNQLVLNLARPDVQEYLWEQLDSLLSSAPIDYVKWDFNRCFTDAGWPGEAYPQKLWVEHVEALYGLLDRLRAEHPGVAFESCSGGGGRIDLGVMARTDQVWTSDNTDPLDRLAIQHGFSQIHPARIMAAWVTDSPNAQLNGRISSLRFRFVSAMAGVLGVGGDLADWSEAELVEAREWVDLYKEIRPVVQRGDLYRLRPPEGGLSAVQYVHGDETVVLALLQAQRHGEPVAPLRLRGLDPSAAYECRETGEVHRGAVLLHHGLRTGLRGDFDAAVIRLRRM